jgi:signal transduction histidine kinase/CheY-like chemotaxis protein
VAETYASNVAALSPAYAEDFGAKAMKALQGETETIDVSHPFRRPVDGRIIWLHSIAIVIRDENEKVTEIHGVAQDITDLMEMNQQLEAARDAAEASTRAKSSFLANMSHELRTPMNAIIGYSEMLAEELEDEELDGFIPDVKKIHAAGQHLLALINDILDLSKIEAGRMDLYLEHFDFQKLLTEAQDTVMPLIEKNGNRLETNFDEDIGSVRADMTKVRQSLFNLLSNAAKFTHEGVIRIEARRENRDGRDTVVLSVSDSGIGIPEDRIDHVFEEFSQADQSTTKDYGGTGLGLAISRRFCRMMGGDLTATSVVGEGSTFTMVFPAKVDALEAAKAAGERKEGSAAPGSDARLPGSGHVLVIDDDPEAREILRRSLEAEGLQVLTADSGAQGLEIALEKQPSVITLDVLMPGMDGWQVLRELKRDDELSHIPVVLVTMLDDKGLGFALGAADYLTKPVNREVLRRSVRNQIHDDASGHALIVDDDDGVREVVRRTLESEGWRVDEAANGRIGLDRVSDKTPDLIILDLMMPVMDGFDFMQELRTRHENHIPTVILTAKELSLEERKFLEGQEYQVLAKGNDGIASVPALVKAAIDGTRRTA